jgi:predicted Rossmann-fold nucleotide-binding protein
MRVLVCGGRNYADRDQVYAALDAVWHEAPHDTMMVIQGGAKGADALARDWCVTRMVEYANVPADWQAFGLQAGPLRNQKMISKYRPSLVLAFPGGKGTADMCRRAIEAGIPIKYPAAPPVHANQGAGR